jgi:hypothetical protein
VRTDDKICAAIDLDRRSRNIRIGSVAAFPKGIAQHGHACAIYASLVEKALALSG